MNEIELKARELLAEMARGFGQPEYAYHIGCGGVLDKGDRKLIAPIIAALTSQWQPIESAPKDGSMFLCWVSAVRFGTRDDGSLAEEDCSEADFGYWMKVRDGGVFHNLQGEMGDQSTITHWQPLPAPPEAG
ncbi:TPA: DUF551 domain-containing protein [Stenotrophomonas maltophilia]